MVDFEVSSARDVRCVEFVELVTEWMEDALTDTERLGVEEHIAICPECTIYLAQFRDTIAVMGSLADEDPLVPVQERLLAEFRRLHSQC